MSVFREPSNQEKVVLAHLFFNETYGWINPVGTVFFWSWMMRMHKPFCHCHKEAS